MDDRSPYATGTIQKSAAHLNMVPQRPCLVQWMRLSQEMGSETARGVEGQNSAKERPGWVGLDVGGGGGGTVYVHVGAAH